MRLLFISLFSFAGSSLLAQTKEIAFKSHSGNMENFKVTINNELFDNEDGGFGLPPPKEVKTYKLDSVIYVSDTVSVKVIREYVQDRNEPASKARFIGSRKDTLYSDPLLGRKHALDSIKTELGKLGSYVNPVSETIFFGYDNKRPKKEKDKNKDNFASPVTSGDGPGNSPFDGKLVLMLGTILGLSLLGGWVSWKFYQPKFQ
ncbi:MAG TPA: hypothetical protein VGO58_19225 [Chitinophagaceae bacterium]|jgi:hypothetical protein|nr:hypothetical protein [Chitinophagaceae bacterium]